MNYFYMDEQNREIGPISGDNLKSFRVAGVIKDHTLVRPENGELWVTAMSIVEPTEKSPSISKTTLNSPGISAVKPVETPPPINKAVQSPVTFSQSEMKQKKNLLVWLLFFVGF